jgi:hypothetical protein
MLYLNGIKRTQKTGSTTKSLMEHGIGAAASVFAHKVIHRFCGQTEIPFFDGGLAPICSRKN